MFIRPNSNGGGFYYYQAIQVRTFAGGTYNFTSSSPMSIHGYFYYDPFDPSYPDRNLMFDNHDDVTGQFLQTVYLSSSSSYVLIVTTTSPEIVGSFAINVSGPASIDLTGFTPSSSRPMSTTGEWISDNLVRDRMERRE